MEPVFKKMDSLTNINQNWLELRNWLLPMLINGQISIRDAEEHVNKIFSKTNKVLVRQVMSLQALDLGENQA